MTANPGQSACPTAQPAVTLPGHPAMRHWDKKVPFLRWDHCKRVQCSQPIGQLHHCHPTAQPAALTVGHRKTASVMLPQKSLTARAWLSSQPSATKLSKIWTGVLVSLDSEWQRKHSPCPPSKRDKFVSNSTQVCEDEDHPASIRLLPEEMNVVL